MQRPLHRPRSFKVTDFGTKILSIFDTLPLSDPQTATRPTTTTSTTTTTCI